MSNWIADGLPLTFYSDLDFGHNGIHRSKSGRWYVRWNRKIFIADNEKEAVAVWTEKDHDQAP